MPKPSTREAMLKEGLRLCLVSGFSGASVRDITRAAGAPLGSFNNHFTSKDAFASEILDLYRESWRKRLRATILDEAVPPLEAFRLLFALLREDMRKAGWRTGCLLSHYSLEVSSLSEGLRAKLLEAQNERSADFTAGLRRCVEAGHLAADLDCEELAANIDAMLQGALLKVRVGLDPAPFDRFQRFVLSTISRRGQAT